MPPALFNRCGLIVRIINRGKEASRHIFWSPYVHDITMTHLILFDGECGLCHRSVQFVLRYDQGKYFKFAAMQSAIGQRILQELQMPAEDYASFLYIEKGSVYQKSTAVMKIAWRLSWPARLLLVLAVIPRRLRDWGYDQIAGHRFYWFGKRDICQLIDNTDKDRFIE